MDYCQDCERFVDGVVTADHGSIDTFELACPYCGGDNIVTPLGVNKFDRILWTVAGILWSWTCIAIMVVL